MKVLLIMNEERQLPKGTFIGRELNTAVERKVIIIPLVAKGNITKMDKLADVMKMALSLDEFNNTDNLENGRLNNTLLTYHMTVSEELMHLQLAAPQYKRLKNGEFTF